MTAVKSKEIFFRVPVFFFRKQQQQQQQQQKKKKKQDIFPNT